MALTEAKRLAREGKADRTCVICGCLMIKRIGEIDYDFWRRKACSRLCGNRYANGLRWQKPRKDLASRFEEMFIPEPNSGCWLWFGATVPDGYGSFGIATNKTEKAHRVSWKLHKGPIPPDKHVLHTCDNRCCVNPDHLWLGTNEDNVADRVLKGRSYHPPKGLRICLPKLKN